MSDPIAVTYAAGTFSIISSTSTTSFVNDSYIQGTALTGSTVASGYVNVVQNGEAGSFNCNKNYQTLSLGQPGASNT